jgi:phosphate/sulfate permease
MGDYYFYLVVLLFLLAIADLVIGVSNDAVNFLNSSLGSRAANRKVIMWIASAGILIGALSSGGMMEIAQKGVFRPGMFVFDEIMIIFVAVMLTDILLLDFFNTFALPTSTTVSIVFELLGAACAVALYKIFAQGEALAGIGTYINGTNALIIVSGIFLSVLLAFTFGVLVQYASRLLFTFHYEYQARFTAPVFGAVAITSITYFLLIKGLKGSGLLSPDAHAWIKTHTVQLIVLIFGAWLVINSVLAYFRVNILRVVVLTGTFALAMAFAGNDLVNFIGVAIGGLTSYEAFAGSGVDPSSFSMAVLENPVESQTIILLAAGLVMVLTLWFSKKAQAVTETEINLSRQGIGAERFKANLMSRLIVRGALAFGTVTGRFVPRNVQNGLEERFYPRQNEIDPPPFDLVRASVNLMVASILIALATSYKLPLSTTYVSFMVAMGTSLADRAWDRDSAVFRVSGVLHVIGGWLFTAILAFSAAGLFALLIRQTGGYGILGLTLLSVVLVTKNTLTHRKRVSDSADRERPLFLLRNPSEELLFLESKNEIQFTLSLVRKTFHQSIKGLLEESRRNLRIAKTKSDEIKEISDDLNRAFLYHVRSCKNREAVHMQYFISVIGQVQHLAQITEQLASLSSEYVENKHTPLNAVLKKDLANLDESLRQTYKTLDGGIEKNSVKALIKSLEEMRGQIKRIQKMIVRVFDQEVEPGGSSKLSFLVVNVYIRSIDMINASMHLTEYYIEFLRANEKETYEVPTSYPSTL